MYTLSLADFITGIVLLSTWLKDRSYICKISGFVLSLSPAVSSLSIFWIAVDKFCLIHYPFKYNSICPKTAAPIIVPGYSAIACALLLWISVKDGALFGNIHFDPLYGICLINFQNRNKVVSVVITALAGMGLPVIVLTALYLKMALTAYKQARRINGMVKSVQRESSSSADQRATLVNEWKGFALFAVVSGAFFLAWLPFWTTKMLHLFTYMKTPPTVYIASGLLTISNSWWNPVIYTFGNRAFRKNLIKLFKCKGKKVNLT
ncbi:Trace amine-associated receptor 5 [Holothuria leucospilota]|uniref:Trace amine-associated receptor 5 n=1 Tax=Holothuria leucospilota TaxID=206669 RepID=A0A9Q1BWH5_HOLLE|nr:Trace amine-associated receptor 5 [Holothuria leucospilota]